MESKNQWRREKGTIALHLKYGLSQNSASLLVVGKFSSFGG